MQREPPPFAGVSHEYVEAAGVRIHVAVAGPEEAPPVLLLHGWPQSWWAWRRVIPDLAERFRLDRPGPPRTRLERSAHIRL